MQLRSYSPALRDGATRANRLRGRGAKPRAPRGSPGDLTSSIRTRICHRGARRDFVPPRSVVLGRKSSRSSCLPPFRVRSAGLGAVSDARGEVEPPRTSAPCPSSRPDTTLYPAAPAARGGSEVDATSAPFTRGARAPRGPLGARPPGTGIEKTACARSGDPEPALKEERRPPLRGDRACRASWEEPRAAGRATLTYPIKKAALKKKIPRGAVLFFCTD